MEHSALFGTRPKAQDMFMDSYRFLGILVLLVFVHPNRFSFFSGLIEGLPRLVLLELARWRGCSLGPTAG